MHKELSASAKSTYRRYQKAHLIAIDDIMLFPLNKTAALAFFHLINLLHEQCAQALDDEVLATALLGRLLFRCEVIKLEGTSYRIDNRKRIFTDKS